MGITGSYVEVFDTLGGIVVYGTSSSSSDDYAQQYNPTLSDESGWSTTRLSSLRDIAAVGNMSLQCVYSIVCVFRLGFGIKGGLAEGGAPMTQSMPDYNMARFRVCGRKHVQERSHECIVLSTVRVFTFFSVNQRENIVSQNGLIMFWLVHVPLYCVSWFLNCLCVCFCNMKLSGDNYHLDGWCIHCKLEIYLVRGHDYENEVVFT